ncbi:hypothetical protein PM082_008488 [Marasmius tenuissimus]|nr:hypothetical protein PM082_008488 [Marasmius tenuissimus]
MQGPSFPQRPYHAIGGTFSVVPPFALLLMKLRGWFHNRTSSKFWLRRKIGTDAVDIQALLHQVIKLNSPTQSWFPAWFTEQGKEHAREFLRRNPDISRRTEEPDCWIKVWLIDASQGRKLQPKSVALVSLALLTLDYLRNNLESDEDAGIAKEYLVRVIKTGKV